MADTLNEKMKRLWGPTNNLNSRTLNNKSSVQDEDGGVVFIDNSDKGEHERKWDYIESGVENVYLLRNRRFEKYFECKEDSANSINMRPEHWPKAWSDKDVVWDSIGMLWADKTYTGPNARSTTVTDEPNRHYYYNSTNPQTQHKLEADQPKEDTPVFSKTNLDIEEDESVPENANITDLSTENSKSETESCLNNHPGPDESLLGEEHQMFLINEHVKRVRDELAWDYLVVYFDQCLVEVSRNDAPMPAIESTEHDEESLQSQTLNNSLTSSQVAMGGFFDGVCTVSFRTPRKPTSSQKEIVPYLVIESLATEKSLSDEENEKVTKQIIQAILNLSQLMARDVQEHHTESVWYKGFNPLPDPSTVEVPLVCIAFEPQPRYFKMKNCYATSDGTPTTSDGLPVITAPNDLPLEEGMQENDDYESDFLHFWKERIGFKEPTVDEILRVMSRYKAPFLSEYQMGTYAHEDQKEELKTGLVSHKRKMPDGHGVKTSLSSSSDNNSKVNDGNGLQFVMETSDNSSTEEDDDEVLMERAETEVKLLVIKPSQI